MNEGSHPQNHIQPVFTAQLNKPAQIAAAVKAENTFFLLMMNPENISGNHIYAPHLHFNQFIFPP